MTRLRTSLTLGIAVLALAVITGCGAAPDLSANDAEGQVLASLGFDTADLALAPAGGPSASPSAGPSAPNPGRKHRPRIKLRKNVLHGESVVQTKDGVKTVAFQRGTVTAISTTSVTVKSTDGFTQSWTIGDKLDVVQHRKTVQPSEVKAGAEIGIAGPKENGTPTARLIVLP
jgi:hypothetical protein